MDLSLLLPVIGFIFTYFYVSKLLLLYSTIDKTSQGFDLLPVDSKAVPSVIASSVCWSLQCLISVLTQGGRWWTLFLGLLVQSHCGEGGMLQTNNTGMCLQCLRPIGPALTHSECDLPAHTAQALGCSSRMRPRPALGCMHLPGLSR